MNHGKLSMSHGNVSMSDGKRLLSESMFSMRVFVLLSHCTQVASVTEEVAVWANKFGAYRSWPTSDRGTRQPRGRRRIISIIQLGSFSKTICRGFRDLIS